jgi:hypothetical protein
LFAYDVDEAFECGNQFLRQIGPLAQASYEVADDKVTILLQHEVAGGREYVDGLDVGIQSGNLK